MRGRRRSVRKFGAVAALLALALQFVLSFAHIHPEDFFPVTAHHVAQAGAPGTPSKPAPAVPTDDSCAICISMAMAGSSATPALIPIVPPLVFGRAIFPPLVTEAPRWTVRVSFRSRAPPLV
jgi:hypothetical protein